MPEIESSINRAARALLEADALLITAGAGMGVDSGLPDFRGPQGFWRAYPAIAKRGLRFEEMANPFWFDHEPDLAWAFYGHRLNLYRRVRPHDGFTNLLEWARARRHGFFVFTSNVDGHFQRAGFPADRIMECHGSLHHFQCARPCDKRIWDAPKGDVKIDEPAFKARSPLPSCPECGGGARPNVLMFGDGRWNDDRARGQRSRLDAWLCGLRSKQARLVILEFGAGKAVPTVRAFSERAASMYDGTLVRINTREPQVPSDHIAIPVGAAEAVQRIESELASLAIGCAAV